MADKAPSNIINDSSNQAPKKNHLGALIFCLFVFGLPLLTVYFSKSGLDKYKDMRGEMQFLKDSIRVDFDDLTMYWDAELSNEFIKGKLVLVAFWKKDCQPFDLVIDSLKAIRDNFNKDDQNKMLFVIHADDYTQDSTWSLMPYAQKWGLDTSVWKFSKHAALERYQLNDVSPCTIVTMLDGRVSRKDDTENYKKGPLLCHHYNIKDRVVIEQMLKHMAVIMPAKQRKSIEYRAEEDLYQ